MKCIEVWQKLNLASDKAEIKYDKKLTQKLSLCTEERSIQSTFIIQENKHLLTQKSISDEDLLTAITKAAFCESDRNAFLNKNQRHQHNSPSKKVYETGVCKT